MLRRRQGDIIDINSVPLEKREKNLSETCNFSAIIHHFKHEMLQMASGLLIGSFVRVTYRGQKIKNSREWNLPYRLSYQYIRKMPLKFWPNSVTEVYVRDIETVEQKFSKVHMNRNIKSIQIYPNKLKVLFELKQSDLATRHDYFW